MRPAVDIETNLIGQKVECLDKNSYWNKGIIRGVGLDKEGTKFIIEYICKYSKDRVLTTISSTKFKLID